MTFDSPIEFPAGYLAYFEHFNDCDFFEAHEVLEDVWAIEVGTARDFYKGLIMVAAGLHQWRRGRCGGAFRLYRDGRAYLSRYPDVFQGFELSGFIEHMDKVFEPLLADPNTDCPSPGDHQLPRLTLLHFME